MYDIRSFPRSPETDLDPILLVVEHLHASHVVEHGIVVVVHHIVRHHGRKVRALGGGGVEGGKGRKMWRVRKVVCVCVCTSVHACVCVCVCERLA